MEKKRILIVTEALDRKNYLEYHMAKMGLKSLWYPNLFSAMMSIQNDPMRIAVVDLILPVEPKLQFIFYILKERPELFIIVIGKTQYIKSNDLLPEIHTILLAQDIESVPGLIKGLLIKENKGGGTMSSVTKKTIDIW